MKNFLIFSSLAALSAALPAAPPPEATPAPMPRVTFRLLADPANKEVAHLGFLDKSLSYSKVRTGDYRAIYDEQKWTVNATDGSGILWLRPTHGTPMYYVFNGDPNSDPTPPLTISKWQISNEGGKQYLGAPSWMLCGEGSTDGTKYLYYEPQVGPPRCTNNFKFLIVWDVKPDDPTETVTATETVTETTSIVETETCSTDEPKTTETCTTEEPKTTETCTTEEPETIVTEPTGGTETCITQEPTETATVEPTDEPTETAQEPTTTSIAINPTGTSGPLPPPGQNTTVTRPPVPTGTGAPPPEIPDSSAALKIPVTGLFALVVAAGMAVFIL